MSDATKSEGFQYYQILKAVRSHRMEAGRWPGLRELSRITGIPKTTLSRRLGVLESRGAIRVSASPYGRLVVERIELPKPKRESSSVYAAPEVPPPSKLSRRYPSWLRPAAITTITAAVTYAVVDKLVG